MKLICIFIVIYVTSSLAHEWVDPHDMNTNAKAKYTKPTLKKSSSTSSIDDVVADPFSDICYSHLRRIVSVLMNSAHVDKRNSELYHGHIRFNLDPKEFDFLANFGKDDLTLEKLRKLDTIFSEGFRRSYIDEYLDTIETFQLKLYSLVVNIQNLWLLGALCLLYVVYQLFKNDFSFSYIIKYLIILTLIVDFGFRYHYLLEEAEEHNLGVAYSQNCDTNRMSWGKWTTYLFKSTDCGKRTVTPLDAFLYQIKNLIIIPMHALGTGMGGFGNNMFTSLPWGLNLIMWPIMVVLSLIFLLFLITICTGQLIEFNIFHLIKLKFGGGSCGDHTLMGPAVERLVDKIPHRPMVQNVHVSVPPNDNKTAQENIEPAKATLSVSQGRQSSGHSDATILDQEDDTRDKSPKHTNGSKLKKTVSVTSDENTDKLGSQEAVGEKQDNKRKHSGQRPKTKDIKSNRQIKSNPFIHH